MTASKGGVMESCRDRWVDDGCGAWLDLDRWKLIILVRAKETSMGLGVQRLELRT